MALQADYEAPRQPGTLGALMKGTITPPFSPEHFNEELRATKVFSYSADYTTCERLYRDVAIPLLGGRQEMDFMGLAWSASEWRRLGSALTYCPMLQRLNLESMGGLDDNGLAALLTELGTGALPSLIELYICPKFRGEVQSGVTQTMVQHLGHAFDRGVAKNLRTLWLVDWQWNDQAVDDLKSILVRAPFDLADLQLFCTYDERRTEMS